MSEVTATGMLLLYPKVCCEGIYILTHTFPDANAIRRGQTLYLVQLHRSPRTSINGQVEMEAHSFCYVVSERQCYLPYWGSVVIILEIWNIVYRSILNW